MRITGTDTTSVGLDRAPARRPGRVATPPTDRGSTEPAEAAAAPAAPAPSTPAEGAGAPEREHGLVGASAHANRSPVAALRVWLNHAELRDRLPLPDLEAADVHGRGFEKAVAAYRAATTTVPEPDPGVTDPVVTDPVVVVDPPVVVPDGATDPVGDLLEQLPPTGTGADGTDADEPPTTSLT